MLRPVTHDDLPFLWAMLGAAANPDGPPTAVADMEPELRRYLDGWGAPGDVGLAAEGPDGDLLGAAWYRPLTGAAPGYGYVDDATPEIAIACTPTSRGQGIGTRLIDGLLDRAHRDGLARLCLSVRVDNLPAVRVYENCGFRSVALDDDGLHATMVAPTRPSTADR